MAVASVLHLKPFKSCCFSCWTILDTTSVLEPFCSSWVQSHHWNPLVHGSYFLLVFTLFFLFSFPPLSLLLLITVPALKNFFGAVIVKWMLNTDDFFPPFREILFENRIAVFRLLLSPCCPCAYWYMEGNR